MSRRGFTLIELLLAVGVIGVVSSVVIIAVSPKKQLTDAVDAERKHNAKELTNALYANLIDRWEMAGGGSIPSCSEENKGTCAKPVCREEVADEACTARNGVSLRVLPPEYITQIPVDRVVPGDDKCTGYMVYQNVGRPMVFPANVGKMPGDVPAGTCGAGAAVIASGLLGYWKFDEGAGFNALDSSGNNYHGQLAADGAKFVAEGSMRSTEKPPAIKFANAGSLRFDGSNDFVRLSHNADLRTYDYNDFTIMAWYKSAQTSTNVDQYIFGQYTGSSVSSADKYGLYLSPTDDSQSPNSARFHLHQGSGKRCSETGNSCSIDSDCPGASNLCLPFCCTYGSTNVVTDQQWHHLAIVRRSGSAREVWIDGVKEGSTSDYNPATLVDPRDGPTIGAETKTDPPGNPLNNEETPNHLVNGWIDDVRVYSRALSQSEIEMIAAGDG